MNFLENDALFNMKSVIVQNDKYFYGFLPTKIEFSEREKREILDRFPAPSLPNSSECLHISDFNDGTFASNIIALVDSSEVKTASNGKPYLQLELSNGKGSFKGKVWADNGSVDESFDFFSVHKCVYLSGKVEEFPKGSGNKSLTIRSYLPCDKAIDPISLLPVVDSDFESMILEICWYFNQISEPHRTIAFGCFEMFWDTFRITPGAKRHHHAYLGGLLKHYLGMLRIAWYLGKKVTSVGQGMFNLLEIIQKEHKKEIIGSVVNNSSTSHNRLTWGGTVDHIYEIIHNFARLSQSDSFNFDTLVAAIPWHDPGKRFDYTYFSDVNKYKDIFPFANDIDNYHEKYNVNAGGIAMDELGSLVGHMPYGVLMFRDFINKYKIDIDLKTIHLYMHLILSHHGKFEWGSPVTPQNPTAWVLHFVDYLDSRYETYDFSLKKAK